MKAKENSYYIKVNKKVLFLLIGLLFTSCIILAVQALPFFEKEDKEPKPVTYTNMEVRAATIVNLSNFRRSTLDEYDQTSRYDQNFYSLDVYVTSVITTPACVTLNLYSDGEEAMTFSLNFDLYKNATVVKSIPRFEPNSYLYNDKEYKDTKLSWGVDRIESGECK